MLDAGTTITSHLSGTIFEVMELEPDRFVLRYTMPGPTRMPDFAEHLHMGWHEEFKILEGDVVYRLDGKEASATAGDTVIFPENVKHIHPMNRSDRPVVLEQHGTVTGHGPQAVRETFGFFFTMIEWEAAGKIKLDKLGLPRHPLKFAVAGRRLVAHGGYDARIPKFAAEFAGATFGRLGEWMGYTVIDPKWLR
ncbi:MAG: cupin domain-containing protein [Pseudomonadota bacterium]